MAALGASLSVFRILVANSWMQVPGGGHFAGGRFMVDDYRQVIFNQGALTSATHMWVACLETTLFGIAGPGAWPECTWQANDWSPTIANGLILPATHSLQGQVRGLRDFPEPDQSPALPLLFHAFRLMVATGFWCLLLTILTFAIWQRGRLTVSCSPQTRGPLKAWVFPIPLGFLAVECGRLVREIGRQSRVVYGVLRTSQAASTLPAATVATTLTMYTVLYTILSALFIVFARRLPGHGPDTDVSPGMNARHAAMPQTGI